MHPCSVTPGPGEAPENPHVRADLGIAAHTATAATAACRRRLAREHRA